MPSSRDLSLISIERSPLTQLIARVLILTLLSWSLPFDTALPRRASAGETTPAPRAEHASSSAATALYVNANVAAACNGKAPCFTTIQGAIDAIGPGQRIEIQAGTYVERLEVQRKNASAAATEAQRIVIEADPAAAPGSVVLRGRAARCEAGYAIEIARSRYVTIRGLTIVGAGGRGIGLRGGSLENRGVHLERNRIGRGGPRECNGGIDVGRGNPQTVIANNLIYGNGRNGIRFRDGRGGSYYVIGNTIVRNAWSGVQIAHASAVELVNNVIVANGTAPGAAQARVGMRRLRTNPSPASQVRLLGNLICGNVGGELAGPLLDATDASNLTPTGAEGPGVTPSAACGDVALLFRDANGADDAADTADDDFHLTAGSPATDAGVDPRGLGYPAPNAVFEADFDAPGARPRDGDGNRVSKFDAGAHERTGDVQPSVTPSASPSVTPTPSPSPTSSATSTPTATPTPTAAPTVGPNRFPTIVSTPITRIVVAVPAVDPPEPSFDFLEMVPSDVGSTRGDVFSTLPTTDPTLFGFTGGDVRKVNFDTTPGGTALASGTQLTTEYASLGVLMSSIPISSGVYGGAASPPNATFIGPIGGQQSFTFTVPVVAVGIINTSPDQDRIAFYSPGGELMFSIRDQDSRPGPNFDVDRFVGARVTDSNLIGSIVFQNQAGNDEFDELIFEVSTAQLPKANYVYDCDATDPDLDTLTYFLLDGPAGMQIDSGTGRVTWTPTSLDVGTHTVKIRVEDGRGGFDEQQYQLEVVEQPAVPNVIGGTQAEADDTLRNAGFVVGMVTTRHDPQPAGTVLGQTPIGGARAPSGSAVDLVVSLGPEPLPTPLPTPSPIATPTQTPIPTANGAPVAVDDEYTARIDGPLTIPAPGVLGNDHDPDGSTLTAELIDPPAIGTLSAFGADGSFTYQPPAQFVQPGLNPVVRLRVAHGISGFGQVADFDHDGHPDVIYSEFAALRALDGETGAQLFEYDATDTTDVNVSGCNTFGSSTIAVGDLTGSGDVSLVRPLNCDQTSVSGSADRFFAVNGSQITAGKVRATWVTDRLTQPHPDALVDTSATAPPVPPIRPDFAASAYTEPSLARLDATGGVKVLARRLIGPSQAAYIARNGSGAIESRRAGCRAVTGLAADEGRQCRVTWIIDGSNGAVESVLTAPNPSGEQDTGSWRPWRQNAPIVADLDGDGEVEIVSGSDVFRRVAGSWQLAWQTTFEPASVAVADLDGDGTAEVIQHQNAFAGRTPADVGIFVYRHDGTLLRRIPPRDRNESSFGFVSIADADGDGAPEILYTSDGVLYVYRGDGRLLWLFVIPDRPEPVGALVPGPVALFGRSGETAPQVYDLDLDGRPEVILNASARLFIFDGATGTEQWSVDNEGIPFGPKTLALADFDADGHVDILAMTANRWNCANGGGPVSCLGSTLFVSGDDADWAAGPKVFNQLQYRADAVDDAAHIVFAPAIRRDFRRAAQQGTVTDPRLRAGTTFTYRARDGGASSSPATVYVAIAPENSPPSITSLPPTGFLSVTPYTRPTYQITATDPDPGDTLHYELVSTTHPFGSGPGQGVNVDPSTGVVDFYVGPCGSFGGGCDFDRDILVVVAAVDSLGARDEQSFLLTISPSRATVPDVVGMLLQPAIDALLAASLRARALLEIFDAAPAGTVIAQSPVAGTADVPSGSTVDLTLSKGPEPTPAPTPSPTPDPDATPTPVPTPGPPLASIIVEPASAIVLAGDTQAFTATGVFEDGTSADLTTQVTWSSGTPAVASITTAGVASALGAGASTLTATFGAIAGNGTLTVVAQVAGDTTPPVAAITAPTDGTSIVSLADVIGTASDANLLRWDLEVAPAGDASFTTLATGTSPVSGAKLGKLDPTLLLNELYTLRLTVYDRGGNSTAASVTVQLARDQKVGLFSVSFKDLEVSMPGLPITVERTYDSRDKARGDFGVGWRLDLRSLRVRKNRVQGEGWTVTAGGFGPTYQIAPLTPHRVSVTLPDGRVEEFELTTSPASSFLVPFFELGTAYVPLAGTLGTLVAVDPSSGLPRTDVAIFDAQPGDVTLVDAFTFDPFDPQAFRYTTVDGTEIFVHVTEGVKALRERNGNTLTFTPGGITHSSGATVAFTRDAQQRITRITDLAGATHDYAYDANGDLVRYTDAVGNVTRFKYDRRHGLLEVVDPLGNRGIRNEYDPDGRLIATLDAKGKRTEYQHLQGTMQQVETNRLGYTTVREYDAAGNVVRLTDANGKVSTYTYDARGNQLSETDPLGRTASRTYDARNNVLTETDVEGRTTTRTYDGHDKVLTVTNAAGNVRSFAYDAAGNQLTETDPEGGVTTHTYDARGNRLTTTDATGATTTWTYDALGRRLTETDALGRTVTSTFDANGRELTSTRTRTLAGGGTQTLVEELDYDASGRLIGKTDTSGGAAVLKHGARTDGKVSGIVDQRGLPVDFDYDEIGNLTGIRYADGSVESFDYDAEGRLVGQGDRDGQGTTFGFDVLGRQTRATHPDGSFIEVTWDDASRLTSRKDERGNVTTYTYAPGQQIVTDALGKSTTIVFDAAGRRSSVTDALGRTTSFAYDGNGNLLTTTFPDGSTSSSTWDGEGRRTSDTDQAGRTTTYTYDVLGRLMKVTDAAGGETTYDYDEVGNLVAQTDAEGRTTRFEHDALGRQTKRIRPLGGAESSAYDGQSNRTARTDFAGATTAYAYDGSGRVLSETLPGGEVVLYEYTSAGLRTRAGDDTFAYDARGRMVSETKSNGDEIGYGWDAAGNRTSVTTTFGTTSFTYDALNRLASMTDTTGTTTYGYDDVGNLTSIGRPNGTSTAYGYDALNRLTLVENAGPGGLISSYAYTLDVTGKRRHVVESGPATTGRVVGYDYDDLGRLVGEVIDEPGTADDRTVDYGYDAVGNRLSKVETQGTKVTTTTYVYDDDDKLLSESTLVQMASAAPPAGVRMVLAGFGLSPLLALLLALGLTLADNRRPGRRARRRRTWTTALIAVLAVSLGLVPSLSQSGLLAVLAPGEAHAQAVPSVISYDYDANGNLISRSDGSASDTYDFDARGRMVASTVAIDTAPASIDFAYDADGNRTSRTVGGESTSFLVDRSGALPQVLAETTGAETVVYARGHDLAHMVRTTTGAHFFLADGAGSTRQLASSSGVVTDAYTYDAFGNLTAESGATPNDFLFRGEQLDPNVGFYNLRARWYSQATGRFVSPDPFEGSPYDPASLHRYLYAHANPVSNEDPSGLFTLVQISIGIGITAGLAAGITAYLRGASVVQAISIGVATGVAVGLLVYIVGVVGPHLLRVLVQSGQAAFQAASRAAQRALEKVLEAFIRRFPNNGADQIVNLLRQALSRITDAAQRAASSGGGNAVSRQFVRDAVQPILKDVGAKLTAALQRVIASSGGRVAKAFFCATLRAYASPSRLGTLRLTGAYLNPTSSAVDLFVPVVYEATAAVCRP